MQAFVHTIEVACGFLTAKFALRFATRLGLAPRHNTQAGINEGNKLSSYITLIGIPYFEIIFYMPTSISEYYTLQSRLQ